MQTKNFMPRKTNINIRNISCSPPACVHAQSWPTLFKPMPPQPQFLPASCGTHPHLLCPLSPGTRAGPADPNQPKPLLQPPFPTASCPLATARVSRDPDPGGSAETQIRVFLLHNVKNLPSWPQRRKGAWGLPFTDFHPTHPAEVLISSFWNIQVP